VGVPHSTSGVDVPVVAPFASPLAVFFFFFLFLEEEVGGRVKISNPVSVILLISTAYEGIVISGEMIYRMVSSN
jgi:hypothetical protein